MKAMTKSASFNRIIKPASGNVNTHNTHGHNQANSSVDSYPGGSQQPLDNTQELERPSEKCHLPSCYPTGTTITSLYSLSKRKYEKN